MKKRIAMAACGVLVASGMSLLAMGDTKSDESKTAGTTYSATGGMMKGSSTNNASSTGGVWRSSMKPVVGTLQLAQATGAGSGAASGQGAGSALMGTTNRPTGTGTGGSLFGTNGGTGIRSGAGTGTGSGAMGTGAGTGAGTGTGAGAL